MRSNFKIVLGSVIVFVGFALLLAAMLMTPPPLGAPTGVGGPPMLLDNAFGAIDAMLRPIGMPINGAVFGLLYVAIMFASLWGGWGIALQGWEERKQHRASNPY